MTGSHETTRGAEVELTIDSLSAEGSGVGRLGGKAVFVAGALPGEIVRVVIDKQKARYAIGRMVEIDRGSAQRCEPRCEYFGTCGGCVLQHLDPAAQLEHRQAQVIETLKRLGPVEPEAVDPPIDSAPWGYRRRASLGVRMLAGKGCVIGFRKLNSSYIHPIEHCMVLEPSLSRLIQPLAASIARLSVAHRIPRVDLAAGDRGMAVSVRHLLPLTEADRQELRGLGRVTGAMVRTRDLDSGRTGQLWPREEGGLEYDAGDGATRLGFQPEQFIQVNDRVNRALVRQVLDWLAPSPNDQVVDAFCGAGNFSVPVGRCGARVRGYEGDASLVVQAGHNARRNSVEAGVTFTVRDLCDDLADYRPVFEGSNKVLLDPARAGAVELVKALPGAPAIVKLVYASCNAATLARDSAILTSVKGYRFKRLRVAQMFPHTAHVECVALFEP